jgi:hypothetical protein
MNQEGFGMCNRATGPVSVDGIRVICNREAEAELVRLLVITSQQTTNITITNAVIVITVQDVFS